MRQLSFATILIFTILLVSTVSAIDVRVEKLSENEVLVIDTGKPVVFDLNLRNLGVSDTFEFYNLLGFEMFPVGTIAIGSNSAKKVELKLSPLGSISERGFYTINYFIKSSDGSQQEESLTFKIMELEKIFEVGSSQVNVDSNSIEIFIKNKENFNLGEIKVDFSSVFFNTEETFELGPKETKHFTIELERDDFLNLVAGFYTIRAKIDTGDKKTNVEGIIKFIEKNLVTTTKKNYGFFINTQVIEKKNDGNTIILSETVIKKNIISRLFTSFNLQPDVVERIGSGIYYTWNHEIKPGETAEVEVKTNWLFPLFLIFFIVAIVILTKKYSGTNLILRKKVSFVRAKGGEFALKVSVFVNSKKYLERVNVIDRLPPLVKIYEKFGREVPTRFDEKTRRIEWNFEKLEAGETRVLSYIIYSKVGVMGRFALPTATAIFEKEGEIHEAESNRAFFINEPLPKKNEDDEI
jgi:hypothetical protein